jgi:hypothetical protein
MNNLKVWTFHIATRNTLIFIIFSILLVILQKSLQSNLPFLNTVFLKRALLDEWYIVLSALPAMWLLIRHKINAKYAFGFFCILVTFRSLESLILNFNKISMMILFIYVCLAYSFFQLLSWTFSRSMFSSNYLVDELHDPMSLKIPIELKIADQSYQGHLTNWDSQGVFVYLDRPWVSKRRNVVAEVLLQGHRFGAKGTVVTATLDRRGIGLEWKNTKLPELQPWESLMELFDDFGWIPQLLR